MFKDLTDLEVYLLERALNTERNTINKECARFSVAQRPLPETFAKQVEAIERLYFLAEEEDMRRTADRLLNDQMDLLIANEIAMNCGAI